MKTIKWIGALFCLSLWAAAQTSPYHKTIERGIPIPEGERKRWKDTLKVSDHYPYKVRVKIK